MSDAGLYRYRAHVDRWVDADTIDLLVDLGFSMFAHLRFRLARVNAPERGTPEHPAALEIVERLAPTGAQVFVESHRGDRYGRWVGEITTVAGLNASDALLAAGVPAYAGKT